MRAKVPVIKVASDTPGPSRFNVGINLRKAERDILKKMMAKRGNQYVFCFSPTSCHL